jgi:hypothetical protein
MLFEEPAGKQPQKLFIVDHKCEWMRCFVHHSQRTHLLFSVVERLFSWLGLPQQGRLAPLCQRPVQHV